MLGQNAFTITIHILFGIQLVFKHRTQFKHMKKGNVKLMAVSAVIVAVILLGSWIYMDGDKSSSDYREPTVGDLKELESTRDGVKSTMSIRIVAEWEGEYLIQWIAQDGTVTNFMSDDPSVVGPEMQNDQPMEKVGSETIDTPFGKKYCDIMSYKMTNDDGTTMDCLAWYGGKATYKVEMTSPDGNVTSVILKSSTILGDDPSDAGDYGIRTTFQADDRIAYRTSTSSDAHSENIFSEFIVKSVDPATSDLVLDMRYGDFYFEDVEFSDADLRQYVFEDNASTPVKTEVYMCTGGLTEAWVTTETVTVDGITVETTVWTGLDGFVFAKYIQEYDGDELVGTNLITLDSCTLIEEF